jgi:plastocyanin
VCPSRSIVAAVVTLLAAACGEEPVVNGFPPPPVETDQVSVLDNEFDPASIVVPSGTTVTWTWNGSEDHTVVFDDTSLPASPVQFAGTHQVTFSLSNTYTYYCSIHGRAVMSGLVEVRPATPEPE